MAWIIDIDRLPEGPPKTNSNAAGIKGPYSYTGDGSELLHRFRLLTDDREVMYEGRSDDDNSFGPLDNFGMPNAGCTIIQYFVPGKGGGWTDL